MTKTQSNFERLALLLYAASFGTLAIGQDEPQADYANRPASEYVEQLTDENLEVRRRAAYILGRIDAPAEVAVPALVEALSDSQMETRWYAIDALGQFGSQAATAVPDIVKSLESTLNDETVRRRGARTLGRIGEAARDAVPILEAALESDDPLYRIAAADALWRIQRHQRALSLIISELKAEDTPIAFFAATTVAELPDVDGSTIVPELVEALGHSDADVRQALVGALVKYGPQAIEPLSQHLADSSSPGSVDAARALGMIIDQQRKRILYADVDNSAFASAAGPLIRVAFPALAAGMSSDDKALRSVCTLALAQGGSVAAIQLLNELKSENAAVREAAALALVRMEPYLAKQRPLPPHIQRVHGHIIEPLTNAIASEDPVVQRASVRLFVALQIGPAGQVAESHLRQALATGDLATRRFADKALQQIANPE